MENGPLSRGNIEISIGMDVDMDIDLDMAVSMNWGFCKGEYGTPLKGFGVDIRQV